jgi:hypothetical protein
MTSNTKVAAAIAAVLATGSAYAGQPTPAQAASPTVGLYVAGSSAAKNAILGAIETSPLICGGSYSLFSSTGNTNFFAVSCTPAASTGLPSANGSNVYTIWYRTEGGSVVGALPLVSGSQINQLSLAGASGSNGSYTVAVGGSSATNGIDDSFTGGVFKAPVQFGITDVEPTALILDNYPKAYLKSVYGSATASQFNSKLSATTLFDQVFGVFVNTNSSAFNASETGGQGKAAGQPNTLNLPTESITNILQGNSTNWNKVPDTSGNAVTTASLPITIVNREQGSGSRAATSIFFTQDECNSVATSIKESTGGTADYFSTGNVLAAANTIPGSITYASVDNAGSSSYPNLTLVEVDSVYATNLNAAAGIYGDWFEATGVTGPNFNSLSGDQQTLIGDLIQDFQTESSAPGTVDILAIPADSTNNASLPVSSTSSVNSGNTIYINPFSRSGVSCNTPLSFL